MLRRRRQKVVAALAGVLIAGGCFFAFSHGAEQYVLRQGEAELEVLAQRNLKLAENRLSRLVHLLDRLHQRGIDACTEPHMQALGQTALSVAVIKEISLIDANGQTQCTTLGTAATFRTILSSHDLTKNPDIALEIVSISDTGGESMVRVRHRPSAGGSGLAIMFLGSRFFTQRSEQMRTGEGGLAEAKMPDGTAIGRIGSLQGAVREDTLSMGLVSARYGIEVSTSVSKARLHAEARHLQWLGAGAFGGLAVLLLALFLFRPRRQRDNPIAELERALAAGEFVPYYQPIVDLVTGKLRGAEVLIRWRKPDGSTVSPAAFIPLAESSGIILDMTRALMRRVRDEMGPAFADRQHLKVCFNLAARHFQDDGIVRDMRDIFGRGDVRLSQVVLELTERQPIENLAETRRLIATLQSLGVRMAIDDVGTGHSGLSYILKLGVDIIKIDKMFVDAIGIERSSTAIIETLVDLAHNMRMDVVAEGVETFEQVVCLRERGIRAAQGFVFAPPLPCSSFLQLIEAIDPIGAVGAPENPALTRAA